MTTKRKERKRRREIKVAKYRVLILTAMGEAVNLPELENAQQLRAALRCGDMTIAALIQVRPQERNLIEDAAIAIRRDLQDLIATFKTKVEEK